MAGAGSVDANSAQVLSGYRHPDIQVIQPRPFNSQYYIELEACHCNILMSRLNENFPWLMHRSLIHTMEIIDYGGGFRRLLVSKPENLASLQTYRICVFTHLPLLSNYGV